MRTLPMMAAILVSSLLVSLGAAAQTKVTEAPFGKTPDGKAVEIYTLQDPTITARIMTYGGIVVSLTTPDRKGHRDDIVLGFDDLDGYTRNGNKAYFGAIVGRYANRIAHGTFTLDGKTYHIPLNEDDNALHGGTRGFDKAVWQARRIPDGVELTHVSPDGDQGFPGRLTARVRYTLRGNALRIGYRATCDQDTVVNLTNHSYFNLSGEGHGNILGDVLRLDAGHFTPVNTHLIPTGELRSVARTPFDFRMPTEIGARINQKNHQLRLAGGYDDNFVLDQPGRLRRAAATVDDPNSGRVLQVFTDQPGIQFYTGNFLDGSIVGKGGHAYVKHAALALETQHFPDSPNHPNFPSTELKHGAEYHTVTIWRFSTR
jgi:aldose 1-epimerase